MYVVPVGANPPSDEDRQPIWRAVNGEQLMLTTRLTLVDGVTHVSVTNSRVTFVLAETRFTDPIWTGTWLDGVNEVDIQHPGLVKIIIPDDIANSLQRGAYSFSITVANRFNRQPWTPVRGNLLIEYEPTSPVNDIPYHNTD
jgi:hypothetical protein